MNASVTKATRICPQYSWEIMSFKSIIVPGVTGFCLWLASGMLVYEYWGEHVEIFLFAYPILNIFPKFSSVLSFVQWSFLVFTIAVHGLAYTDMIVRRRYAD